MARALVLGVLPVEVGGPQYKSVDDLLASLAAALFRRADVVRDYATVNVGEKLEVIVQSSGQRSRRFCKSDTGGTV